MFDAAEAWTAFDRGCRRALAIIVLMLIGVIAACSFAMAQNVSSPAIITAVTVTSASAQAVAAHGRNMLALDNESTTATVACAFGATAAINTAGSFTIPPQQTRTWNGPKVPNDAINCISSAASSPLTVEE